MPIFEREWTQSGGRAPRGDVFPVHCPPWPPAPLTDEQIALARAVQAGTSAALNGTTIGTVEASPKEAPPWRAIPFVQRTEVVIDRPGVADSTAATELARANYTLANLTETALAILRPVLGTDQVAVLTFDVPDATVLVIPQGGVSLEGHDAEGDRSALLWSLSIGGRPLVDEQPFGYEGLPLFVIARAGQRVQLRVRNRDGLAPTLARATVSGWQFPVLQLDDTLLGTLLKNERGPHAELFRAGSGLPCTP